MSQRILVVDDDHAMRRQLATLFRRQYRLDTAASGEEAMKKATRFLPDLVLLDIVMPGIDGHETCRRLKASSACENAHIVMISAMSTRAEQLRALQMGADDYVVKPIDPHQLRSRVRLHFKLRDATRKAESFRKELESHLADVRQLADERTYEIIDTQDIAVFMLAKVAESRDEDTGQHLPRMRSYSQILAEYLGRKGPYTALVDQRFRDDLFRSSPLHDIGKVAITDAILLKPGPLTPDEFEIMKRHAISGANVLDEAVFRSQSGGFLAMAATIARFHHEKFDGSGYPAGLVGQEIPLPARIVAVADVFDALTSVRPYKPAYSTELATEIILKESGRHFDPAIVEAFTACRDEFEIVRESDSDYLPVAVGAICFAEHNRVASSATPEFA